MDSALPAPMVSMTPPRRGVVPSAVLGTLILVVSETMFFAGLISAFTISKSGSPAGSWPVPGQPTLPASETALNTIVLVLSGVVLLIAQRLYAKKPAMAGWLMLAAWLMGAAFVGLQGREWAALLAAGLNFTASRLASFFYIIVGIHALHALVALGCLGFAWARLQMGKLTPGYFFGTQVFWYFVVLMWPVIYARIYF